MFLQAKATLTAHDLNERKQREKEKDKGVNYEKMINWQIFNGLCEVLHRRQLKMCSDFCLKFISIKLNYNAVGPSPFLGSIQETEEKKKGNQEGVKFK